MIVQHIIIKSNDPWWKGGAYSHSNWSRGLSCELRKKGYKVFDSDLIRGKKYSSYPVNICSNDLDIFKASIEKGSLCFPEISELRNKEIFSIFCKENQIPTPKTISIPKEISINSALDIILNDFKSIILAKNSTSDSGYNIHKINNEEELKYFLEKESEKISDFVFQEFIPESKAEDIRVVFMNKDISFFYKKKSSRKNEFRSNLDQGGFRIKIPSLPSEIIDVSKKIIDKSGLTGGSFDFIESKNGYLVLEYNKINHSDLDRSGKFLSINTKRMYADHIDKRIKGEI